MHLLLCAEDTEPFLIQELQRAFPRNQHQVRAPGILVSDFALQIEAPPTLVFARQMLPDAAALQAGSIGDWRHRLLEAVLTLPPEQPWQLHVVPHYGGGKAGQNRCQLIGQSLREWLQRKSRLWLKSLKPAPAPFTPADSLVQLLLIAPDAGFLSVAAAPAAFHTRRILSPFPKGIIPIASDKAAPSRAFAKLLEAEQRLGQRIVPGQTCVDLGASPGSWSYVALHRGARVIAVDRAPLRPDLMAHSNLVFQKGDAFRYQPQAKVDWLLCDVIAAPERSASLLLDWVRHKRAARFVVTLKFKGTEDYRMLEGLKHALPPYCEELYLTQLCANKNEVCAFGVVIRA